MTLSTQQYKGIVIPLAKVFYMLNLEEATIIKKNLFSIKINMLTILLSLLPFIYLGPVHTN